MTRRSTLLIVAILAAQLALLSACVSLDSIGRGLLGDAVEMSLRGESGGETSEKTNLERIIDTSKAFEKSEQEITEEQEYYLGRAVGANLLSQFPAYPESKANEYINVLGQTLALASDRPETFGGYHFQILETADINAFAAPGGLVFVSRGLLRCTDSEDTVAAILAHEIGHVVRQHGLLAIQKSRKNAAWTSLAMTGIAVAGSPELAKLTELFEDSITEVMASLVNKGYSRAFEKEADLAALVILQRAGYDPNALVRMLQIMDTRLKPGGPDFAKTHPDPQDRIAEIRKILPEAAAPAAPAARQSRYRAALGGI